MSVPIRWQEPIEPQYTEPDIEISRRQHPKNRAKRFELANVIIKVSVLCILAVIGIQLAARQSHDRAKLRLLNQAPISANGIVVLGTASAERNLGFVSITGNITSRSAQPISSVEAMVELIDSKNQTVAMESAMVPIDPLPVHGTVPFHVEMKDDVRAVSYRVHLRQLLGPMLD